MTNWDRPRSRHVTTTPRPGGQSALWFRVLALAITLSLATIVSGFRGLHFGNKILGAQNVLGTTSSNVHSLRPHQRAAVGPQGLRANVVYSRQKLPICRVSSILQAKSRQDATSDAASDGTIDYKQLEGYFKATVPLGLEIDYQQMVRFPPIKQLLDDGMVFEDDIKDLWTSNVGDATGLTLSEAFEFATMCTDLPDPEDLEYFNSEFDKLVGDKSSTLPFYKFLGWDGVQDVVKEGVLSIDEITEIYKQFSKDLNTPIDRKLFLGINNAIDEAIDEKQTATAGSDDDAGINIDDVDIWGADFDPKTAFDAKALGDITSFWQGNAKGATAAAPTDGALPKLAFMNWSDIQDILKEGLVTSDDIQKAWTAAAKGKESIDFDTFLRLNISIDILLDEAEAGSEDKQSATNANADGADFYFTEFDRLTDGLQFMTVAQLLGWAEIQELVAEGAVSKKQITALYNSFPSTAGDGLTRDEFVALNSMLDIMLDKGDDSGGDASPAGTSAVSNAKTPTALISEPSRPMPAMAELKMGSLDLNSNSNANNSEDDSGGVADPADLEMMEAFDQADSLLNSGSFSDFDALIGDENDPRLELKAKLSAFEMPLEVKDSCNQLLAACRKQSRCGLDKPSEEEEAALRNYAQIIADKATKASDLAIPDLRSALTGKWKLLYTNSEMFNFYNGITGFTNVFPGTTFQDLILEYESDGYLNEAKYLENLKTPMGSTLATVYANWELMKETSFMTNENSVILRGYCSKVTAGPLSYMAEENWKSLRTMSMNELVYIDDRMMLLRNAGALRVFFVYERI